MKSRPVHGKLADEIKWILALFLLAVIVHSGTILGGFVWDDDTHLTANLVLGPHGLYRTWFTSHQPNYWPVTWTGFWLQYQFFGMSPAGYHVVNIVLHGLNALLVWRVLLKLTQEQNTSWIKASWLAAALFAIHPVNVECVAWITQFKTLLATALCLASLLFYLAHEERNGKSRYGISLLLFAVALLSKPSIVMLPVVLLLVSWWRKGAIKRTDLFKTFPFFAVAALMSLTEIWFQTNRSMAGMSVRTDGFLSRLAGAGWVIWFYIGKILCPVNLSLVYPRWKIDPSSVLAWIPTLATVAWFAILWLMRKRQFARSAVLGSGYFVVTLFPVLGFFNIFYMRYSFVADHWQYQSMIGIVALVCVGASQLHPIAPAGRRVLYVLVILLIVAFSAMSVYRGSKFRTNEILLRDAVNKNPNAVLALANLGSIHYKKGNLAAARDYIQRALSVEPNDPEANATMGNLQFDTRMYAQALDHYRRALPGMPGPERFKLHWEMAQTYIRMGQKKQARKELENVLRLKPGLPQAQQALNSLR